MTPFEEADARLGAMHGYGRATCQGGPVWVRGVRYEVAADHHDLGAGPNYCPYCGWKLGIPYDA